MKSKLAGHLAFTKNEIIDGGVKRTLWRKRSHKACLSWKSMPHLWNRKCTCEACVHNTKQWTYNIDKGASDWSACGGVRQERNIGMLKSLSVPLNHPFKSEFRNCQHEWMWTSIRQDILADRTAKDSIPGWRPQMLCECWEHGWCECRWRALRMTLCATATGEMTTSASTVMH